MKVEISRFSPHQNAKVFAVLMAVASLVFAVPMFLAFLAIPDGVDARGNSVHPPPAFIALLFPIAYLILGYVSVRVGCWFYNVMFKYVGGIEYETHEKNET